jgi:hypothetical protein
VFLIKELKEKRVLLNEKGFCKERFVLKIVPNIKKREKVKPSKGSECCLMVLSKS